MKERLKKNLINMAIILTDIIAFIVIVAITGLFIKIVFKLFMLGWNAIK
jgi:hypothetical protein